MNAKPKNLFVVEFSVYRGHESFVNVSLTSDLKCCDNKSDILARDAYDLFQ